VRHLLRRQANARRLHARSARQRRTAKILRKTHHLSREIKRMRKELNAHINQYRHKEAAEDGTMRIQDFAEAWSDPDANLWVLYQNGRLRCARDTPLHALRAHFSARWAGASLKDLDHIPEYGNDAVNCALVHHSVGPIRYIPPLCYGSAHSRFIYINYLHYGYSTLRSGHTGSHTVSGMGLGLIVPIGGTSESFQVYTETSMDMLLDIVRARLACVPLPPHMLTREILMYMLPRHAM
jgi:hypothetical protein